MTISESPTSTNFKNTLEELAQTDYKEMSNLQKNEQIQIKLNDVIPASEQNFNEKSLEYRFLDFLGRGAQRGDIGSDDTETIRQAAKNMGIIPVSEKEQEIQEIRGHEELNQLIELISKNTLGEKSSDLSYLKPAEEFYEKYKTEIEPSMWGTISRGISKIITAIYNAWYPPETKISSEKDQKTNQIGEEEDHEAEVKGVVGYEAVSQITEELKGEDLFLEELVSSLKDELPADPTASLAIQDLDRTLVAQTQLLEKENKSIDNWLESVKISLKNFNHTLNRLNYLKVRCDEPGKLPNAKARIQHQDLKKLTEHDLGIIQERIQSRLKRTNNLQTFSILNLSETPAQFERQIKYSDITDLKDLVDRKEPINENHLLNFKRAAEEAIAQLTGPHEAQQEVKGILSSLLKSCETLLQEIDNLRRNIQTLKEHPITMMDLEHPENLSKLYKEREDQTESIQKKLNDFLFQVDQTIPSSS